MSDMIPYLGLTGWQLVAIAAAAILVGMGKAGISAITLLAIPVLAQPFGSKASTGLILCLFLVGDVFAVNAYRRHVRWDEIRKMLPAALIGLLIGIFVGNMVNDRQFKYLIASIILLCLVFLLYQERKGSQIRVPHSMWFVILIGVLSGFATMIGNAAGPIFAVYLLAIGLDKQNYLGTTAWFFLVINLIKLPLQIFAWHNITGYTALLALGALPAIYLGIRLGLWVIRSLNEKHFRYLILAMTALACIRLFI